jgi:S1-C subfamily serine protease
MLGASSLGSHALALSLFTTITACRPDTPAAPRGERDEVCPPAPRVEAPRPCPCALADESLRGPDLRSQVESVVRSVAPSLVQLSAPMPPRNGHLPLRVVAGSAFEIMRAGPLGTGVLVGPRLVLTAGHVVEHARALRARFPDGREHTATTVARAPAHDLVLLQLSGDPDGAKPVPIASAAPGAGEWVIALGELYARGPTVSVGVVTAGADASRTDEGPLELDVAVNLTNTGGPIVNLAGEVVGIASAKLTEQRGMRGLGYGLPARTAKPMVTSVTAGDAPLRPTPAPDQNPLRGMRTADLDGSLRKRFAISDDIEHGALVTDVTTTSPAAVVGVEAGDVIVEIDFEPIFSSSGFERALADATGPLLVLFVRGNAATYVLLHP